MKNEAVLFDTVAPCENSVDLAALLTDIEAVIKKHVIVSHHAAAALAVWVLHTYTFELRDTVAYVAIESPEKRCGKTTLLSVLAAMAHPPLISSNITVGALFRAIHNCSPTLFIDEADTFLAGNSIMRGIINSGNTRRTAYVLRLSASNQTKVGQRSPSAPSDNLQPVTSNFQPTETGLKKYSCWCPKVIAMIGAAPDTIADRSIVVKMTRKLTTETCAPLAELNTTQIRSQCARFASDMRDSIAQHPKINGPGLNDRAADTFDPLYVITRQAGPEWEQKLHAAALALNLNSDADFSGAGLILDIVDIIILSGHEKIFTRDLVARLRDGGLQSQTLKYSTINEYNISKILRPYGIKPICIRIGAEVKQGYDASGFREALKRYVPQEDAFARVDALRQKAKLLDEARTEARKLADQQSIFMEKVLARVPKDRHLTVTDALSLINELRSESAKPKENSEEPGVVT